MTDPEQLPELPPPPPEPERYPFWTWIDLLMLIGLVLPLMLIALMAVRVAVYFVPALPHARAALPIAVQFGFYALWFCAVYALMRLRYGRPFWPSLAFTRPEWGYGRSALIGVVAAMACAMVAAALHPPPIKTPLEELLQDPVSIVLMLIFGVTLGPLCEELAFRGLLQPLLARSVGAVGGIALSAAPFALLHGSEYAWNWQRILIVFLAGAAFGWMRQRTGSTAASTAMHAAYNLTFFVALIAQKVRTF